MFSSINRHDGDSLVQKAGLNAFDFINYGEEKRAFFLDCDIFSILD